MSRQDKGEKMQECGVNQETTERATGLRMIHMENITYRDRRSIGETIDDIQDKTTVAMFLDEAAEHNIDNYGGSGMGAGCFVEATFDDEDPDDVDTSGEEVEGVNDPVFDGLPLGSHKELRLFMSQQRESSCWNGHNHVECPLGNSRRVLTMMKNEEQMQRRILEWT